MLHLNADLNILAFAETDSLLLPGLRQATSLNACPCPLADEIAVLAQECLQSGQTVSASAAGYLITGLPIKAGECAVAIHAPGNPEAELGVIRELAQTIALQSESQARQELFLKLLAHDVHSPLAGMQLALTLAGQDPGLSASRYFPMLEGCVQQLDKVIASLGQFLEIQGDARQGVQLLSFAQLLQQAELELAAQLQQSGARLESRLEVAGMVYLSSWMQSILRNLLSNAIKFAHPQRPLLIVVETTRLESGQVRLSVHDNGIGFPAGQVPAGLFGPCQRFHPGYQGKGLGLYLVRSMLEKNGGSIRAESRPEGCSFHLILGIVNCV
ncbi:MAG TPA: HAMP domain-containing sensor histidine kinase [Candidatus Obscuribacterales bacterium]